jgi:hypothetical protein
MYNFDSCRDHLTTDERRLIDEAVAAGRVRKYSTGAESEKAMPKLSRAWFRQRSVAEQLAAAARSSDGKARAAAARSATAVGDANG